MSLSIFAALAMNFELHTWNEEMVKIVRGLLKVQWVGSSLGFTQLLGHGVSESLWPTRSSSTKVTLGLHVVWKYDL